VLASTLRRYRRDGAFYDLEQRLLHALARDVAGDRVGVEKLPLSGYWYLEAPELWKIGYRRCAD
jgi:hypothetical protein